MPRTRTLLTISLAACLGIGIYVAQRSTDAGDRERRLEARFAALETAAPRQGQHVIQREVRVEVASASSLPTEPKPLDQPTEAESATTTGRAIRTNAELAAAYATVFAAEAVDPTWAADAERRYLPAIQQALTPSSQLISLECRTQFCEVAVVHDSIDTSNSFILDLFAMDRHGPLFRDTAGFRAGEPQRTADSKLLYRLYIGRPGVQLALDPPRDLPVPHDEKRQ